MRLTKNITLVSLMLCALNANAETHIIKLESDYENMKLYFSPSSLKVQPGDTVTWFNDSDDMHNVTSFPDGYPIAAKKLASPMLNKRGDQYSYTFDVAGTYQYHCQPHLFMNMKGEIIVGKESAPNEFYKPTEQEVESYKKDMLNYIDASQYKYLTREEREKITTENK